MQLQLDWLSLSFVPALDCDAARDFLGFNYMRQNSDFSNSFFYLTQSEQPSEDYARAVVDAYSDTLVELLRLDDLLPCFDIHMHVKHYALEYNLGSIIVIRVPHFNTLFTTGFNIYFSSDGLALYQNTLEDTYKTDLRSVLLNLRKRVGELNKLKCPRIDIAADDICKGSSKPLLKISRIRSCLSRGEFCSRLRSKQDDDSVSVRSVEKTSSKSKTGDTIYLGNRKSLVSCRFYDKLLELQAHNKTVPDGVTHWVRCEFEFKNDRAQSVLSDYLSMTDAEFSEHMACVFNHYVSFISLNNAQSCRCTQKKWWTDFLKTDKKEGLYIPPYEPMSFNKSMAWLNTSVAPTLATLSASPLFSNQYALVDNLVVNYKARLAGGSMPPKQRQLLRDCKLQYAHTKSDIDKLLEQPSAPSDSPVAIPYCDDDTFNDLLTSSKK